MELLAIIAENYRGWRLVSNLCSNGLLIGHGGKEGLSEHGCIVFNAKRWLTLAVVYIHEIITLKY